MAAPIEKYPASPTQVDPRILEPSPEFKREAAKSFTAIVFFIIVYFLLISSGFGLVALCGLGAFALIVAWPSIITIMLSLGLVGLGVMVVLFLIKFLFKKHTTDRSALLEVTEAEQPLLFAFVRAVANETKTSFPKRIYLSPEVNASVFYDSSFWSMFLPVRKNLHIGLGLVNSINISEFKAILAHEFGHFSQDSMKLGSYVYNMNQIIYNLLYDNDSYHRMVERWANVSGYFAIFATITMQIIGAIQWSLQRVYSVVNKHYLSLSRQMEFHADTVSAAVSGANHLISSLRRLEIADLTFQRVIEFYQRSKKEKLKPDNVYPQQRVAMSFFAEYHGLTMEHGLPRVHKGSFGQFSYSQLVVKDQWASHPSTDDREKHLESLNISTPAEQHSAWTVFIKSDALQKQMTEKLVEQMGLNGEVRVDEKTYFDHLQKESNKYKLPALYKGFLDERNFSISSLDEIDSANVEPVDAILTDETLKLPYKLSGILADLDALQFIQEGNHIQQFEFSGNKYKRSDAHMVSAKLREEEQVIRKQLILLDKSIIAWFLHKAKAVGKQDILESKSRELFELTAESEEDFKVYTNVQAALFPLYQPMPIEQIKVAVANLKTSEAPFKKRLERILFNPLNQEIIDEEQRKKGMEFLAKDLEYFRAPDYFNSQLELLTICMDTFSYVSNERVFHAKAEVLKLQATIAGICVETEPVRN